jgi:pyruvate/2-oxoglutarate dehydrogenase complex dihydrolipoamide acyltransferase (E2) component
MTEGMVSQWPLGDGKRFKAGDIAVVAESDKTAFDVEAPAAGSLLQILVAASETVPVGTPLAEWQLDREVDTPVQDVAELGATRSEGVAELCCRCSLSVHRHGHICPQQGGSHSRVTARTPPRERGSPGS